jgi:hypothetical protein
VWITGIGIVVLALAMLAVITYLPSIQPPQKDDTQTQSVQNGAGSDGVKPAGASMQELAERLLSDSMGSMGKANLLPGKLPGDLPLSLSALEGWRVVGSVTYSQTDGGATNPMGGMVSGISSMSMANFQRWTVVLDAPGSPSTAWDAVQNSLKNQGWAVQEQNMLVAQDSGGFLGSGDFSSHMNDLAQPPGGQAYHVLQLCNGTKSLMLTFDSYPLDSSKAGINLSIENFGPMGCAVPGTTMPGNRSTQIPSLTAPDGISIMPGGGSYGGSTSVSEATAITDKSSGWLENFYATQLEKAGWTRQGGKDEGLFAWSIWQVPVTGGAQGFLYVLATPAGKTSARGLQLRVDSTADMSALSSFGTSEITTFQQTGTK